MTRITTPPLSTTSNKSKRTFTITLNGNKYRTLPMTRKEFEEATYWSETDWKNFLKTNQYTIIK